MTFTTVPLHNILCSNLSLTTVIKTIILNLNRIINSILIRVRVRTKIGHGRLSTSSLTSHSGLITDLEKRVLSSSLIKRLLDNSIKKSDTDNREIHLAKGTCTKLTNRDMVVSRIITLTIITTTITSVNLEVHQAKKEELLRLRTSPRLLMSITLILDTTTSRDIIDGN